MTPNEKAEQLVVEYIYLLGVDRATGIVAAERCVKEIIEAANLNNGTMPTNSIFYWSEVQEEIENL